MNCPYPVSLVNEGRYYQKNPQSKEIKNKQNTIKINNIRGGSKKVENRKKKNNWEIRGNESKNIKNSNEFRDREIKKKSKIEERIGNYKKDNEWKEKPGNNSGKDYGEREENNVINTNNPRIFENIKKKGNINKGENINRTKTKNKRVNVENTRRNRNSNQHPSYSSNIKAKKKTLQRLRIGTLNVRTLRSNDNLNEVEIAFEDSNIDILGMSEVRRFGERLIVTKRNDIFFYRGNNQGQKGVGFLIKKEMRKYIEEIKEITDKLTEAKIEIGNKQIVVLQVYTPITTAEEEEIEEFYSKR